MLKTFGYTKANGDKSVRTAYILNKASDLSLCVDLTEFDEDERQFYNGVIDDIRLRFSNELKKAGLSGNLRTFKEKNMEFEVDINTKVKAARAVA